MDTDQNTYLVLPAFSVLGIESGEYDPYTIKIPIPFKHKKLN